MKLGANTVLFGGYDMEIAFKSLAMAGYDGVEISAIEGMGVHLAVETWRESAPEIKRLSQAYTLELLAMEHPSRDPARIELAMQAAAELGIPIINCGPGGKSGDAGIQGFRYPESSCHVSASASGLERQFQCVCVCRRRPGTRQ